MALVVYQSHRLEDLLAALAALLQHEPLPPLATETIVVPTRGLARWVELQLARQHGIAAGLRFPFPGAFLAGLLANDHGADGDPLARELLQLRLFRLLGPAAAAAGPAADYVQGDTDGRRRFQLATRLAAAFDDYQLYRSDLLRRAAAGDALAELGPHGSWQAALWRTLLALDGARAGAAPGRIDALRQLLGDPERARARLPARLCVFGAAALPPAFLDLLQQIADLVPVHLYTPLPSPEFFGDLRARRAAGNPLLARFGTLAREFADHLLDLESAQRQQVHWQVLREAPDPATPLPTLLQRLQADIVAVHDRGADGDLHPLHAEDDSLRVHDCHSPQRELEVVRDQVLQAFAADATLEPHDILVLVPDIHTYAPYAEAVFGPVQKHVPFQVADRDPASDLSLCAALLAVLALAEDRVQVQDVLRLVEEPALQRRFGLQAADLPVLRHWCEQASIRWGLDATSRAQQFGLPAFADNSWQQGLERLLLGAATGPLDDLVLGLLPVADGTTGRLDVLARFLAFLRTLFGWLPQLRQAHPPAAWAAHLDQLVADLYAPDAADEQLALQRLQRATAALRTRALAAGLVEPLTPAVLQAWLRQELQASASNRGFLTGAVTIAALQPMRTVPVRRLFLCGMADQTFPRRDQPLPFDWLALQRRPGDRSVRLDDRQLFLDALLAARDALHLTYVGHSAKDDSECAPSPVLAELLDQVDRSCRTDDQRRPREQVVVRHPLQPWSPRYRDGRDPRLFTYAAAAKGRPGTAEPAPFVSAPVAVPGELLAPRLPLEQLLRFWANPSRFYLEKVLGLRLPGDDGESQETEPFRADGLDRWRLQDELVGRALRGVPLPDDLLAATRATGRLPVGGLGAILGQQLLDETRQFLARATAVPAPHTRRVEVAVGGWCIEGDLDRLGTDWAVQARISELKPKEVLRTWILHLVTSAARGQGHADLPPRRRHHARTKVLEFGELAPADALHHLEALVEHYRAGLAAPLPFFELCSHEHAQRRAEGLPAAEVRSRVLALWQPNRGDFGGAHDSEDPWIALAWRGRTPLDEPAFAELATVVWAPCLDAAEESSP